LKIKAILGRGESLSASIYEHNIGSFEFNARLRTLRQKGEEAIKLSPKEAQLLNLLCLHRNDVLPREKALKQIWKEDNYFTGRSMDVYIVKLRKYMERDARVSIENIHGAGYSLKAR
jgi:DNA-binding response OmpR family regulator